MKQETAILGEERIPEALRPEPMITGPMTPELWTTRSSSTSTRSLRWRGSWPSVSPPPPWPSG